MGNLLRAPRVTVVTGQMDEQAGPIVSLQLAAALRSFRGFVVSDDSTRSEETARSEVELLTALIGAVQPLFPEINAVLDRLISAPHPLRADEERLEEDLNSLAQAAMEARFELGRRSPP